MANLHEMKAQQNAGAVTATMKPRDQIAHLLKSKAGEIQKMLPKHLNAERLLKVAQIAATTTPGLAKCDVPSLIGAIGQCAQMGLEPNTVLGHAYLVPFKVKRKKGNVEEWVDSVQVIVGYKGLIDLARRSGQIVSLTAHEVCANDKFELSYGLDEKLNHTPCMDGDRGAVIGFYAIAKFKDGGHAFEFMSKHQVDQIAKATQSKGAYGPWKDHYVEMGRKTAIRRLAKYLPLSIEFQTAVALDEQASSDRDQHLDANTLDGDFSFVGDEAQAYGGAAEPALDQPQGAAPQPAPQGVSDEVFEAQLREVEERVLSTPAQQLAARFQRTTDLDTLDADADLINDTTSDPGEQADLRNKYHARRAALTGDEPKTTAPAPEPHPPQQTTSARAARPRSTGMSVD